LLALHLAFERPRDVCGLALLAPAIALRDWRARFAARCVARVPWLRARLRFITKSGGSDINDAHARRAHPAHAAVPLRGVVSLLDLQRRVRHELGRIAQPSLLIHGALDRTCPVTNVEVLRRGLGAPPRRVVILPQSAHVVTVDCERHRVRDEVAAFVGALGL
jgi:carboxylesterase